MRVWKFAIGHCCSSQPSDRVMGRTPREGEAMRWYNVLIINRCLSQHYHSLLGHQHAALSFCPAYWSNQVISCRQLCIVVSPSVLQTVCWQRVSHAMEWRDRLIHRSWIFLTFSEPQSRGSTCMRIALYAGIYGSACVAVRYQKLLWCIMCSLTTSCLEQCFPSSLHQSRHPSQLLQRLVSLLWFRHFFCIFYVVPTTTEHHIVSSGSERSTHVICVCLQ